MNDRPADGHKRRPRPYRASSQKQPSQPQPLANSIERLLGHLNAPTASTLQTVFDRWDDLVGPGLAEHTEPVSLVDRCLVIAVDDPAWASQLSWDANRVIDLVNGELEGPLVETLQTRIRPTRSS